MSSPISNRRGFTLIETLCYLVSAIAILAMAIQLIHSSLSLSQTAKRQWQQDSTLARLNRDVRRDLQLAMVIEFEAPSNELKIALDNGGSIRWSFQADGTQSGGSIVGRIEIGETNSSRSSESYLLPSGSKTALIQHENSDDLEIRLTTSSATHSLQSRSGAEDHEKLVRTISFTPKKASSRTPTTSETAPQATTEENR